MVSLRNLLLSNPCIRNGPDIEGLGQHYWLPGYDMTTAFLGPMRVSRVRSKVSGLSRRLTALKEIVRLKESGLSPDINLLIDVLRNRTPLVSKPACV